MSGRINCRAAAYLNPRFKLMSRTLAYRSRFFVTAYRVALAAQTICRRDMNHLNASVPRSGEHGLQLVRNRATRRGGATLK